MIGAAALLRRARTADVRAIRTLIDGYARDRILLAKENVTLYEDIQEFWVVEVDGQVQGCGALHVMWEDLAEVRTLAIDPCLRGTGLGVRLLDRLIDVAAELGVKRVFCLTFEVGFFRSQGFTELADAVVPPEVYAELLRSGDEGVAEFLGLDRVKPNTLGNTRMIRLL